MEGCPLAFIPHTYSSTCKNTPTLYMLIVKEKGKNTLSIIMHGREKEPFLSSSPARSTLTLSELSRPNVYADYINHVFVIIRRLLLVKGVMGLS